MIAILILLGVVVIVVGTGWLIDKLDRQNWPDGFPPGSMWG